MKFLFYVFILSILVVFVIDFLKKYGLFLLLGLVVIVVLLIQRKKKLDQSRPALPESKLNNKITKEFYSDYPEKPHISKNRDPQWVEQAQMMPKQRLVKRDMMVRFPDGLLPGHVYMLYWLKKNAGRKVPGYFEYKYGIDFETEKAYLYDNDYLDDDNKPTEKGEAAIGAHNEVIVNHAPPRPSPSIEDITKRIKADRAHLRKMGFTEYEFICNTKDGKTCDVCLALNGKHFPLSQMKPGVNAPPMHKGCRCSIAAWEDNSEYDAWLDHLSKGGTTESWNRHKK